MKQWKLRYVRVWYFTGPLLCCNRVSHSVALVHNENSTACTKEVGSVLQVPSAHQLADVATIRLRASSPQTSPHLVAGQDWSGRPRKRKNSPSEIGMTSARHLARDARDGSPGAHVFVHVSRFDSCFSVVEAAHDTASSLFVPLYEM
ncbi:hypothetical protein EVAR_55083_1 [Eumeta japonica]|uniref:Uncharacterized protein n=1 Tax=Eumeta variegata TaxID=151549 RepID=A0A4C1YHP8_EUMVA|nr:hypothetical protein EVAR_55083_1 [Eumeta japonica]